MKHILHSLHSGYRPSDPEVIKDRISTLENAYEELKQLAEDRKSRLNESRKLWQFYWDMADEEGWIREKEQLMSTPDLGHDLTSVHLLLNKQKVCLCPCVKIFLSEFCLVTCFGSLEVEQVCIKISTYWFMSCNAMG